MLSMYFLCLGSCAMVKWCCCFATNTEGNGPAQYYKLRVEGGREWVEEEKR